MSLRRFRKKGIFKADRNRSEFYPYPNEEGNNFLFVCERTEEEEQAFREASVIVLADGREIAVQPIPIGVSAEVDDGRGKSVTSSMLEDWRGEHWFPSTIRAPSIWKWKSGLNRLPSGFIRFPMVREAVSGEHGPSDGSRAWGRISLSRIICEFIHCT